MPFGAGTVMTNYGKASAADRLLNTPTRSSPRVVGMGVGATGAARTAAAADVALSTQVESRVTGADTVVTTTVTGDTFQTVATITATAARVVDEAGAFNATGAGSDMVVSATFAVINLATGDSIQFTIKIQFT